MKRTFTTVKPRSNSRIPALPEEQRKLLETWLFKENTAYREVIQRAKAQFGVKLDMHALMRFYRKINHERNVDHIANSVAIAEDIAKAAARKPGVTAKAFQALIGKIVFHIAVSHSKKQEQNPDQQTPDDLKSLTDALELLVASREDQREDQKFSLEREKWEFDVVRLVQEHHAALEKISKDESLDEDARLLAIRKSLFGEVVPE